MIVYVFKTILFGRLYGKCIFAVKVKRHKNALAERLIFLLNSLSDIPNKKLHRNVNVVK